MTRAETTFKITVSNAMMGFVPEPGFSLTGAVIDGAGVNLGGSGFGPDATPFKFDDFESGTPGSSVGLGGWSTSVDNGPNPNNEPPLYDNTRSWSGVQCAYANMLSGGDCAAYLTSFNSAQVYCSFMHYYTVTGSPSTQKGFRAHADDGPNVYTSHPGFFTQDYNTVNRVTVNAGESGGGTNGASYYMSASSAGQWFRTENYWKLSTPGIADGSVRVWRDLNLIENNDGNIITRDSSVSDIFQVVMLPFYFGNGGGGENWLDDVYISKTQSRLEIGNANTWGTCTKRTIQNPQIWSDTSIEFTLRFVDLIGEPKFLFHVDAGGNATLLGEFI